MKKILILIVFYALAVTSSIAQTFTLKSKEIGGQATNKQVFNSFGCTGQNLSPQLYWENVPAGTNSFVVTMYDPDAPTGSGWWHWIIFDIPSKTTELVTDAGNISKMLAPAGSIQSKTDFGQPGYGGPCPPQGDKVHEYLITVYALKVEKLGLDQNASPAMVGFYTNQNFIAKSSLIMYYKR